MNNTELYALKDMNLTIQEGEMIIILGQSGSGKSTLMNVISGLDRVTNGQILYKNKDLTQCNNLELDQYRRDEIGFIFQTYNLIPNLKVYENVELGAVLGTGKDKENIDDLLKEFDLTQFRDNFPYQLSGGGKQRVAISRALAKKPSLLMCDEPTGALDEANAIKVMKKLQEYNAKYNTTIVVITHNPAYARAGHRAIYINNGQIVKEVVNERVVPAEELRISEAMGARL
ncbi:MAG TPA: ABC transporter ATP-binding protein [Bacillales bacterium]|nr:ABC transporter ATP-binding protein [Bacillales bacterium]